MLLRLKELADDVGKAYEMFQYNKVVSTMPLHLLSRLPQNLVRDLLSHCLQEESIPWLEFKGMYSAGDTPVIAATAKYYGFLLRCCAGLALTTSLCF